MPSDPSICPDCGVEIPSAAPGGVCPRCLLEANTAATPPVRDESAAPGDPDATLPMGPGGSPPPSTSPPPPAPDPPETAHDPKKGAQSFAPSVEELNEIFPDLEVLSLIGAGGMGAVYQAKQSRLDRMVALKILSCPAEYHENFALRFEREAQLLAQLNHPNIVTIYDFGEVARAEADPVASEPEGAASRSRNLFYFVMEFVDGADLNQLIRTGDLDPEQALAIVPQICDALQYAHDEGITHRDVKPANILVDRKGSVRIADFGLAKLIGGENEAMMTGLTMTGTSMGTPHYMAPEQWESPDKVDHRADIYSLGVVFYEMLTGERPAGIFDPPSRKIRVDVRVDDVVLKAMEREPERRYQQASEVKEDVTRVVDDPREPPRLRREGKGGISVAAVFGGGALLAVIAAGTLWGPKLLETPQVREVPAAPLEAREQNSGSAGIAVSGKDGAPEPTRDAATGAPGATGETGATEAAEPEEAPAERSGVGGGKEKLAAGRLNAFGTFPLSGDEIDLSPADPFDDFVDVFGGPGRWVALRQNGQTISSDGKANREGVRKLVRGLADRFALLTIDGKLAFPEGETPEGLPDLSDHPPIIDAALGTDHGLLLTEDGNAIPWSSDGSWKRPPAAFVQNVSRVAATGDEAATSLDDGQFHLWDRVGPVPLSLPDDFGNVRNFAPINMDHLAVETDGNQIWRLYFPTDLPSSEARLIPIGEGSLKSGRFYLDDAGRWREAAISGRLQELIDAHVPFGAAAMYGYGRGFESWTGYVIWIEPASAAEESTRTSSSVEPLIPLTNPGRLRGFLNADNGSVQPMDSSALSGVDDLVQIRTSAHPNDPQIIGLRANGKVVGANLAENWQDRIDAINAGTPLRHLGYNHLSMHHLVAIDREGKPVPLFPNQPVHGIFPDPGEPLADVRTAQGHGLMLTVSGRAIPWGSHFERTTDSWPRPPEQWLTGIAEIRVGAEALFFRTASGEVRAWGRGGRIDLPEQMGKHIVAIGLDNTSLFALDREGNLWATATRSGFGELAGEERGEPYAVDIAQLKDRGMAPSVVRTRNGPWTLTRNWEDYEGARAIQEKLAELGEIPVDAFKVSGGKNASHRALLWIEPADAKTASHSGEKLTAPTIALPPELASMRKRGGRLRFWSDGEAPVRPDLSPAEGIDGLVDLDGDPSSRPDLDYRWMARRASGEAVTSFSGDGLSDFPALGGPAELAALGRRYVVFDSGDRIRIPFDEPGESLSWPGQAIDAAFCEGNSRSMNQFGLILNRDGTLIVEGQNSPTVEAPELQEIAGILGDLDDVVQIDTDWQTAVVLRANGELIAWNGEGEVVTPVEPVRDAVDVACGTNFWLALEAGGSVRMWGDPSEDRPYFELPTDLETAYAVLAGRNLCAAQMADGSWRAWLAWGNPKGHPLVRKIESIGPAVDLFWETKEFSLLWIEPKATDTGIGLTAPLRRVQGRQGGDRRSLAAGLSDY